MFLAPRGVFPPPFAGCCLKNDKTVQKVGWIPSKVGLDMLSAIIRAPGQMLAHARVYGALLALTGIHGVLYLLNADIYSAFLEGNGAALLYSTDVSFQVRGLFLIFASLFFTLYTTGIVSRSLRTNTRPKNSLAITTAAFTIVLLSIVLGLFVILRAVNEFSVSGGIMTLLSSLFLGVAGLIIFLCVIKFSFAPTYVGMGLLPKEALSQSWSLTRGKLLSTIVLLFAILVVATFIQGVAELATQNIEDETLLSIILFVFSALGLFYSGTVLALAAPEPAAAFSPRVRGKK